MIGAGGGDRTHITNLESWGSAIELHPRTAEAGTGIEPECEALRASA